MEMISSTPKSPAELGASAYLLSELGIAYLIRPHVTCDMMVFMTNGQFVGYFRVSTQQQGASGLGLEAQRAAVEAYVRRVGGELVDSFVEVESSRKVRPELQSALRRCQETDATLAVARLDRLGRDLGFLVALQKSNARFVAVDNPSASTLTLNILMSVAQSERDSISERTKGALAALKARGVKLGSPRPPTAHARTAAAAAKKAQTAEKYRLIGPLAVALRTQGQSLGAIALRFEELRIELERRGSKWSPSQVSRVLEYAARPAA